MQLTFPIPHSRYRSNFRMISKRGVADTKEILGGFNKKYNQPFLLEERLNPLVIRAHEPPFIDGICGLRRQ